MDFLEKVASVGKEVAQSVVKTTGEMAQSVVKTTGELYDKSKTKINIVQAQSELKDIFLEFGEYIYKAEKSGCVDAEAKADFMSKADAITEKIEELEAIEENARAQGEREAAEKSASKQPQTCTACGAVRVDGAAYCGSCGAKF
ncbi:MAG: zinc ribbon domain-containing protein [Oscillospiraceae bacterium]